MSFVANGSAPANSTVPATIEGDGWYPALELAHFRAEHRIEEAVTPARVRGALLDGYITAAAGLTRWRAEQEAAGALRLEDVVIRGRSDAQLGGEPLAVILWRRAVYASAAASLADTQHDITATEAGRDRREAMGGRDRDASAADCLRRDAIVAMRDLMGRRRAKAALI